MTTRLLFDRDLLLYWLTIWLTDDAILISAYFLDDLILGFYNSSLRLENGWFELTSTTLVLEGAPTKQVP